VRRSVAARTTAVGDGRSEPIPIEVGPGVDGVRLRVDKRRFERVMANLMENASLYAGGVSRVVVERDGAVPSPRGNGAPSAAPEPAAIIRVVVEDRGPGIPTREREHLFERFYRGNRSGQRTANQGTGLGLSLVAEHVRLHGGRVSIEDNPPTGSRFVIELPLEPDGVAADDRSPADAPTGSEVGG
jgi:two-component system, OmpR family, sensor histidine kinase MtrB